MEQQDLDEAIDQSLMLAVREGDIEKLGMLFERHHGQLFNFFLRVTGDRHWSEDLVQEVFVRLLKYRHTYREEFRFSAWMFQIARNARIDFFQRKPQEEVGIEDGAQEHISQLPIPGEQAEEDEKMQIMLSALSRLPEEKREILLLRSVHGMKFEKIAEIFQCSINTIKARAFRAIRELRVEVEQLKSGREI